MCTQLASSVNTCYNMAGGGWQQQQGTLSNLQLQAIAVAVADGVTQALSVQ